MATVTETPLPLPVGRRAPARRKKVRSHLNREKSRWGCLCVAPLSKRIFERRGREPHQPNQLCQSHDRACHPFHRVVPSDFACSVSSLGQSSLHHPPADVSLRRRHLAGKFAHSWTEHAQVLRSGMCVSGKSSGAISALRLAHRCTRQVSLTASSHSGDRVP